MPAAPVRVPAAPPAPSPAAGRTTLFRPEVAEAANAARLGTILLARPLSHAVLTLLAAACAVAVIAFLASASYTRKATVAGVLLPRQGVTRLVPAQAGLVAQRRVHEGQAVAAGDVLFVVASERHTGPGATAEAAIAALLQARRESLDEEAAQLRRQAAARLAAVTRRAGQLDAELARIEGQMALQARRIALAEAALQRTQSLRHDGYVAQTQVHDREADLLDQRQRLADQARARGASERERTALLAELREVDGQLQRDLLRLQRERAALGQDLAENAARRETEVRAPHDGIVAAVNADVGQPATPAQALATLLPAGTELEAELYAPAHAVGFMQPGREVLLRYRAYPYQKFGAAHGRVREVSRSAVRADEFGLPQAAAAAGPGGEPLYRVRVQLQRQAVTTYGVDQPLRAGASLDASVLLERRRLIEWVLEPLYTVGGRLRT